MAKKKLLLLGGSRYLLPVIEAAHNHGIEAITADYLPDNAAHKVSDRYCNVSIVDKDAVLACAQELEVDGIMSFAADPGVVSAAYAAERMGLPFQGSYEALSILQDKGRFRAFLAENGFNVPASVTVTADQHAQGAYPTIDFPVIVKPVDSAGSKGCTRVDEAAGLPEAVAYALSFSQKGEAIIEEFLEKAYPSSDADAFSQDGKFTCISFTAQLFDQDSPNPYTPAGYAMPPAMPEEALEELRSELQRAADLLGLGTGVYNIETRVARNGKPYIMEIACRGGGNRLCEMLRYAAHQDLIDAGVCAAVGLPVPQTSMPEYDGFWYQEILHADKAGAFRGVEYAPGFEGAHVVEEQLWIEPGDAVEPFTAANFAFGTVFMRFDTQEELDEFLADKSRFFTVVVEEPQVNPALEAQG